MITNINEFRNTRENTNTIIIPQEQPISRIITRENTFSNLGTQTIGATSVEEALNIGGLNYEVHKKPIFLEDGTIISGQTATVRDIDNHVYGIVSDKYQIVQNRDAFGFIDEMSDDIKFEKIGETQTGMIYLIASMEKMNILGDSYQPYLIFRNSHNGRFQLQATICPLRIVCQNQFNVAFRESPNTITIRHSSMAEIRLQEATRVLKGTAEYMKELNKQAEFWATQKVSNQQIVQIIDELFPLQQDMKDFQIQRVEDNKAQFIKAYKADDNGNFRNSMWGLINAYSDYITHREPARKTSTSKENQFVAVTFDPTLMSHFIQLVNRIAA